MAKRRRRQQQPKRHKREQGWAAAEARAQKELERNARLIDSAGSSGTPAGRPSDWRIGRGAGKGKDY